MKPTPPSPDAKRPQENDTPPAGQPAPRPGSAGVDARDDPEKRKENRDRLGVDEEHKTPDMQKHHRGTFP